jgi:glutathione synthase/RimK-type ligase-like ATP-grasp enzyme
LVIKPTVSGAAKDTYRATLSQGEWHLAPAHSDTVEDLWASLLDRQDMMVQPFLPSVVAEGELSLMWLGGTVTHAVKKQAKPGDFRVQDDHGGTVVTHDMTSEERAFAEHAMDVTVDVMAQRDMGMPLYARVDMVRDLYGSWAVSELEMVEPELWFRVCPEAALVLAQAITEHLTKPSA